MKKSKKILKIDDPGDGFYKNAADLHVESVDWKYTYYDLSV